MITEVLKLSETISDWTEVQNTQMFSLPPSGSIVENNTIIHRSTITVLLLYTAQDVYTVLKILFLQLLILQIIYIKYI